MRVISWKCRRSSPYGRVASTAGVSTQPTTSGGSGSTSERPQRLVELAGRDRAEQVQRAEQHQVGPALEHGGVVDRERRAVDLGDPALRVRAAELLAQQRALADAGLADQQVVTALPDARRHLLAGPQERREQLAVGPDAGLRVLGAVVAAQVLGVVAPRRRSHVRALPAGRLGQARRGRRARPRAPRRSASPPAAPAPARRRRSPTTAGRRAGARARPAPGPRAGGRSARAGRRRRAGGRRRW